VGHPKDRTVGDNYLNATEIDGFGFVEDKS